MGLNLLLLVGGHAQVVTGTGVTVITPLRDDLGLRNDALRQLLLLQLLQLPEELLLFKRQRLHRKKLDLLIV